MQVNRLNRQRAVFVYNFLLCRIYRVEYYVIIKCGTEGLYLHIEKCFIFLGSIYMEWGSATLQSERREHTYKPQYMVTMYVRNKDSI